MLTSLKANLETEREELLQSIKSSMSPDLLEYLKQVDFSVQDEQENDEARLTVTTTGACHAG